jgi:hypothetical protein
MPALINRIALVAISLGLPVAIAFADSPPKLNVNPSCEAAARGAISAGRDKEACLADERTAEDALAQNWSKYNAADKTQCIGNVKTGGPPSYVELLSCLEIMRDSKAIRQGDLLDQPLGPTNRRRR